MRNPRLMAANDTVLLLIDLQEKLVPAIADGATITQRCRFLLEAAKLFGIATIVTEQYPKGLGRTVDAVGPLPSAPIEKVAFSACGADAFIDQIEATGKRKALVCGIEAHVCVLQTALDLVGRGFLTYVSADAIGSRTHYDKRWALARMAAAGVTVTTSEAAAFEWTTSSDAPTFRALSQLVKQMPPVELSD